jgi:hypothetical protein
MESREPARPAARVRRLAPRDLPGVAALLVRTYPQHGWPSTSACEQYLRDILFANPWSDLDLPSWVAERGDDICGLYAVMPRRMRLAGRPLRVAVGCQFIVDPRLGDGLVALQMIKACLGGPQDLTIADGATERVLKLWDRLGGKIPALYNLHWTRPLRPARYLLSRLQRGNGQGKSALDPPIRPLVATLDTLAARLRPNRFLHEACELSETDLDCAAIPEHLNAMVSGLALQPQYDAASLQWLLAHTAARTARGQLRRRAVHERSGAMVGWYLYFLHRGGVSEVVQLVARDGAFENVLRRLLVDAWRHGATAVRGRFEPQHGMELSRLNCWLRTEGPWTVFHTRDTEIAAALQQGDAFFSRLDGEWWLGFQGH